MEEVDTVLHPGQGDPDWPAEDGVDWASPLLDTGQDDPGYCQRPGYLTKPVEDHPGCQGWVFLIEGLDRKSVV